MQGDAVDFNMFCHGGECAFFFEVLRTVHAWAWGAILYYTSPVKVLTPTVSNTFNDNPVAK
jgi:hypothetical protein